MTKTENLGLPQWVSSDLVSMDDFNEAFATIDDNLGGFVVGSYTGTGEEITIELGFKPSFVYVDGSAVTYYDKYGGYGMSMGTAGFNKASTQASSSSTVNYWGPTITLTDTGFTLPATQSSAIPMLNYSSDYTYDYIAFK